MSAGPQNDVEIKGLLFDCDGTLVNSMPVWANNWVETCSEFGLELDEERFYQLAGLTIEDTLNVLCREQGKVSVCKRASVRENVCACVCILACMCVRVVQGGAQRIAGHVACCLFLIRPKARGIRVMTSGS